MTLTLRPKSRLRGRPRIPGDKSLSHRALLFGGLASGVTEVRGLSSGEDVRSSARLLEGLGVKIERGEVTRVHGVGLRGLAVPGADLDCGNSGTTMRLFMGVLAGQKFAARLVGDESLSARPMKRVAEPLARMGARFEMRNGTYAPVVVHGTERLHAIDYELGVASAQVKSAIVLAGLYAEGTTRVSGQTASRDHTERLLPYFGAEVKVEKGVVSVRGGERLTGRDFTVPGDPSSAAFWAGAAALVPGGEVEVESLLLNPTRTGFFRVLERMGAAVSLSIETERPEPVGRLRVAAAPLVGTSVGREEVPSLIDEIPLLAVLASQAKGVTEVRGAEELRIKETDRIAAVATNLERMGVEIETFEDGFRVEGPQPLRGAAVDSFHDHRIAMAFSIASLVAEGETTIANAGSVKISYPGFFETLEELTGGSRV